MSPSQLAPPMTPPSPTPNDESSPRAGARPAGWRPRVLADGRWREALPDLLAFAGALAFAVAAAVLLGVIGGCGGGSGVGTEGTGSYAAGPISGFGSIVVNGVHYDESAAAVADADDGDGDAADLALGMMVEVSGGTVAPDASGTPRATASAVRIVRALRGPVGSAPDAAGVFTVLGQAVQLQADTVYGGNLTGAASLVAGRLVEVHGSFDSAGLVWRATRVADAATGASYCVRGTVTAVGSGNFTLNGRSFSLAGVPNPSAVTVGATLKLTLQASGNTVTVAGVQARDSEPDRAQVQLQGLLAAVSGSRWRVDGTEVDVSTARISGTPQVGARAEVTGTLRQGLLVAQSVSLSAGSAQRDFEVEGRIASVDTAARSFVVRSTDGRRSTTVSYAADGLVWRDGASAAALAGWTGSVEVRGRIADGGTVLQATEIRFVH